MADNDNRQRQLHFLGCLQFAKDIFENIFEIP